ncbi:MAG: hypothetical protein L6R43_18875, partial [Planctomycetes bacterium]|nr:hypothetical protein [Planctomycetota bacterium]
ILVASLAGEGGARIEDFGVGPGEEIRLDPGWRRARGVIVVSPPFLASDFLEAPASGPFRAELRPAGLLLLAPEEVFPPALGSLRLRRADGRPISTTGEGGTDYAGSDLEVNVRPGLLLGPFPEGSISFEVRLGGLRLPDARATVRAGRIEVLRISR